MKIQFLLAGVLVMPAVLQSQNVYDEGFRSDRNKVDDRKVIPWPYLKEGDVMFVKRVERIIDTREKQNQPMNFPQRNLARILYDAVKNNELTPYETDEMSSSMRMDKFLALGTDTEWVETISDPSNPDFRETEAIVNPFLAEERIKKYRVVEDWIFDKTRSQYYVRIASIAPQYELRMGGINLGWQDLCVLKYHSSDGKDMRHLLVQYNIFNRQNNAGELSFDDWFEKRLFSSYIIKTSNPHDRYINQYAEFKDNGVDALLEAERRQRELQEREENLYED